MTPYDGIYGGTRVGSPPRPIARILVGTHGSGPGGGSGASVTHHDASLIMTNVQVMAQFVTSLNRTASEVMRMVYDKEPFPTDVVQFVTPACGALHGSDGPVAPYQWSGVSWANTGFIMQFMHVLRGLFSRWPAVMNHYYL